MFGGKKKFGGKKQKDAADGAAAKPSASETTSSTNGTDQPATSTRPKLVFHCQQAQGSPTGVISEFTNVKELYLKIAECYDISSSDILFCTLNTHKIDMTKLLGGQLGLEDFIFAHIRGQPKVVDIEKTEDALGLTITDNGAGFAFIKGIKEGSIINKIDGICVGDHIEKINNESVVGCRHFEVAKMLKEVVRGQTFSLRLIEPLKSGFSEIGGKGVGGGQRKSGLGTGKQTLRLRPKGQATVEVPDDVVNVAIEKINALLEGFLGISDAELAQSIWEIGTNTNNPVDFKAALDVSDLQEFGFDDAFAFDLWGAVTDAKQGRLKKTSAVQDFEEKF